MATYKLRVNGRDKTVDSWDPNQPLLYVLRDNLGSRSEIRMWTWTVRGLYRYR